MLARPPSPRASEAGLDLVEDQERAHPVARLSNVRQVVGRRDDNATLALDGLEQHRGGLLVQDGTHGRDVAEGHLDELGHQRLERFAERPPSGGRQREAGVAVVTVDGRDDLGPARRASGELDREVNGFAAAGTEHGARKVPRRDLGQTRGELRLLS